VQGMGGQVLGDDCYVRWGVSVGATGFVHAPGGEAKRVEATLHVGEHACTVVATGPRVWQRGAIGTLTPSAPRPFDAIAMTWEHAFGGAAKRPARIQEIGGKETFIPEYVDAYPTNPDGMGYYFEERHAENQPLPLLEDATQLVTRWNDRPDPLSFAPYAARGALRALASVDEHGKIDFNRAGRLTHRTAPRLVFEAAPPGTRISLSGMRADGQILAFRVPENPAAVEVDIAERTKRLELKLDAVDIDAVRGDVRLVYRTIFRYPLLEGELRVARLEGTARLTDDVKNMRTEG
ncbi:MAG TPA: DUF2169 domain-containing protein, partial [Minicystis sp.]|nr:DUF2169 domain-containing protein [Minicystis sp.]